MRKNTIIKNAIILTSAGLITKVLGFIYRVYMANTIGAEGIGLYQLILPIYSLAWSLSCSGFTTTISKVVASEKAKNQYGNMNRILKYSIFLSLAISFVISFILYFFAGYIAVNFFSEERVTLSIKILSITIPFMAGGSCIRGYFFGLQETVIPAISQLLEQLTRMVVVGLFASIFIPMGIEYATSLAVLGIAISEIVAFCYVFLSYKFKTYKIFKKKKPTLTPLQSLTIILTMATPLTANRVTSSLLHTVENILIPAKLQEFGLTQTEAIEAFGKLTGMAMPLIYFPSALLTALSISLVPAISEAVAVKEFKNINYTISRTILFTTVIGGFGGCVFTVFAYDLGNIIFGENLSLDLFILGLMCPLLYIQIIMSGILNGLGEQLFIFRNSLLSSIIVIAFIYFLMPKYGILAFLVGLFVSCAVITYLDLARINKRSTSNSKIYQILLMSILSAIFTGLITNYIHKHYLLKNFDNLIALIVGIVIMSCIYLILTIATGSIKIWEIKSLFEIIIKKCNNVFPKDKY